MPIDRFLKILRSRRFALSRIPKIHNAYGDHVFRDVEQLADGRWVKTTDPNRTQFHRRCGDQHILDRRATVGDPFVSLPWDVLWIAADDDDQGRVLVSECRNAFFDRADPFFIRDDNKLPRLYVTGGRSSHSRLEKLDDFLVLNRLIQVSPDTSSAKYGIEYVLFILAHGRFLSIFQDG